MRDLQVVVTRYTPAPEPQRQRGLLGRVAIVLDGVIRLDNLALRRTREDRVQLFYPERRDAAGRPRRDVWPLEAWARREIERQVIVQLAERAARHERVIAS